MGAACFSAMNDDSDKDRKGDILSPPSHRIETSNRRMTLKERSLIRVGSILSPLRSISTRNMGATSHVAMGSPSIESKRASTYDHVHDAVMQNFSRAGVLDSGVPGGVVGLKNLGNTCFINSSLQCLSNTIPLTDYFLGYEYRKEINKDNFLGTGGKLVTAYAELMKEMWLKSSSQRVVQPSSFKRSLSTFAPQFGGNRQHDAQELLSYLLDGIHEDLNRVKKRPYIEDKDCDGSNDEADAQEAWANYLRRNKSLIVDIFQGQFRNTCTCQVCGHTNIRFEPSMYLSLPINETCKSLEDCLGLYLEEEELSGDNMWYCEKCKHHRNATKKTDVWILPPILIIHLKRFKCDAYGRAGRKNDAVLEYPITDWNLSSIIRSRGGGTPIYDLYAVSNHLGGLGGGHYTAYALNRFNEKWYEFNDSSYREINPESSFARSSTPYLLFYNRTAICSTDNSSISRGLLIRRQSVSRPELWPHSQVREGHFRDFQRSSRKIISDISPLGSLSEEGEERTLTSLLGPLAEDSERKPAAVDSNGAKNGEKDRNARVTPERKRKLESSKSCDEVKN